MRIPFFKSRKRKAAEKAAAEQAAATPSPTELPQTEPEKPQPRRNKPRRAPTEQVVEGFGYVLAAVPSLGPTVKAWRKLGFHVTDAYAWQGCQAAHIDLEGGGLRFVATDSLAASGAVAEVVRTRLVLGAGLFGWTWRCPDPQRAAVALGQAAGKEFEVAAEGSPDDLVQVPSELTPGASTWLEGPLAADHPAPSHANSITRLGLVGLQVNASKAAAAVYEKNFGLKGRTSAMSDLYCASLDVGAALLEIVGPLKPVPAAPADGVVTKVASADRITGGPSTLGFASASLDATVTFLKMAGVEVGEPHRAVVQGGRITRMSTALGGIQLAFMGE